MTTTATDVRRGVTVSGSPERAFDLFTNHMAQWWPADHHLAQSPVTAMTVEPRVGGRIFDTCADGTESAWGQVTDWNPPSGFAFAWMITADWQLESDVEKASRVSVTFTAEDGRTRVTLVHNEFWRLRDGGGAMAAAVGDASGWGKGLELFAEYADQRDG
ncbi:ATPase [Skermania sp. ID1734]|uniref:SRPBCC domain-containing protein n=1 Tax=Skermania sp. ID1734 TaxID=2597516 RepID=UPI00117CDA9F|nr:SRPBCC domain-containing protein [Skermania sp. ID1734]TSE00246.1 ATPase [Skermania sp. ID1734]